MFLPDNKFSKEFSSLADFSINLTLKGYFSWGLKNNVLTSTYKIYNLKNHHVLIINKQFSFKA